MAQLSDVLGSIPGLGGYLAKQQFDQQQGTAELANANQFMRLQSGFQDQAAAANARVREDKFRQDVAALGPNAPHEKVLAAAVASGLIGAKDVASMFQTEANKNATIAGNKEMAAMRIQAQINKQKDDTDIKLRNAKTAEERNRIIEDHNKVTEALQGQAAAVGAANLLYNTGMTVPALNIPQRAPVPNGMPQGRLMTADGQAITDPAEIAAFDAVNSQSQQGLGMSMRQGDNGAFTPVPMAAGQNITAPTSGMPRPMPQVQPQGMPQPMPQVAPQVAPQAMPPIVTPAPSDNLDARDMMAARGAPQPVQTVAPVASPTTIVPKAGQGVPGVRERAVAAGLPGREVTKLVAAEISGEGKKLSDDAVDLIAGQMAGGNFQAATGFARNLEAKRQITDKYAAIVKTEGGSPALQNAKMAEWEGIKSGERNLGTRQAQLALASDITSKFVPIAINASEKFDRGEYKTLNDIQIAIDSRTASPELREFAAANNALINVYARAINSQGMSTDTDKNHAREILSTGFSKGDYAAGARQLQREVDTESASAKDVKARMRENIVGGDSAPKYPTATAPNGRKVIFKDGQWQTP